MGCAFFGPQSLKKICVPSLVVTVLIELPPCVAEASPRVGAVRRPRWRRDASAVPLARVRATSILPRAWSRGDRAALGLTRMVPVDHLGSSEVRAHDCPSA